MATHRSAVSRAFLAVAVAYALLVQVLAGAIAPANALVDGTHCLPTSVERSGPASPDQPSPHTGHDCCTVACAGPLLFLPPDFPTGPARYPASLGSARPFVLLLGTPSGRLAGNASARGPPTS